MLHPAGDGRFEGILKTTAIGFRILAAPLAAVLLGGCATAKLDTARSQFYQGRPGEAANTLAKVSTSGKDRVLVLMERGTARQAAGDYQNSATDFIQAADELEKMTTVQIAQDATSLAINDTVQDFRGAPYERTMIHVFAALSHFGMGNFENAAVEARRIIQSLTPQAKGSYPDDAFSHYMAGFCLQMMDDPSNASIEFRKAGALAKSVSIDERTGRLADGGSKPDDANWAHELVCFVLLGRSITVTDDWAAKAYQATRPTYAEIWIDGKPSGRSYNLSDTLDLAISTEEKEAAARAIKTASRIAIKETIAHQVDKDNEGLGELVRFVLILLEQPDLRRWETLPRWLQVARIPCPDGLQQFEVVIKNAGGAELRRVQVSAPLNRRRATYVSFVRDTK